MTEQGRKFDGGRYNDFPSVDLASYIPTILLEKK